MESECWFDVGPCLCMCVSLFVDFGDLIDVVPLSVLFMRERDLSVDDVFLCRCRAI